MGKRKAATPMVKIDRPKLSTVFPCPLCGVHSLPFCCSDATRCPPVRSSSTSVCRPGAHRWDAPQAATTLSRARSTASKRWERPAAVSATAATPSRTAARCTRPWTCMQSGLTRARRRMSSARSVPRAAERHGTIGSVWCADGSAWSVGSALRAGVCVTGVGSVLSLVWRSWEHAAACSGALRACSERKWCTVWPVWSHTIARDTAARWTVMAERTATTASCAAPPSSVGEDKCSVRQRACKRPSLHCRGAGPPIALCTCEQQCACRPECCERATHNSHEHAK